MNFKKRVNGSWHDIPHYIMGTSTDTITNLPAVVYPNDTTATVGLKGNMSQNGTPTPDNPIMPQGTGERTGNLFNKSAAVNGKWLNADTGLEENTSNTYWLSEYIPVKSGTTYSYSNPKSRRKWFYDGSKTPVNALGDSPYTPSSDGYIRFTITNEVVDEFMLNIGSQLLPYEPYGYKIPILCAGQTTPIYLDEVQSTRRIKKLVFDGTENFTKNDTGNPNNYLYYLTDYRANEYCFCTHLVNMETLSTSKVGVFNSNNVLYINFGSSIMNAQLSGNTVTGLKEYLAAQYAAGTPVCVWYVLAEPTTGIVNEPLRKIGDYADEVSGITIPTTAGGDTISVGTTLQPSEVTVNYKGWHPVQSVHEAENGAWT